MGTKLRSSSKRLSCMGLRGKVWRRGPGSNRRIKVLQTSPLPLGYRALAGLSYYALHIAVANPAGAGGRLERETRFELATLALARRCSTTELLPLTAKLSIPVDRNRVKPPQFPCHLEVLRARRRRPHTPTRSRS